MKKRENHLNLTLDEIKDYTIKRLEKRGVTIDDISNIVYEFLIEQKKINVTFEDCKNCVYEIFEKRETLHKIILGIDIDEIAEKKLWNSPIFDVIRGDDGLFGVDELFGINISDLYGSNGYSSFGYFDKVKPSIINKLDSNQEHTHTFLDDLVCGIASAASSKVFHKHLKTTYMHSLKESIISEFDALGISLKNISKAIYKEQKKYNQNLSLDDCYNALEHIISKREVADKLCICFLLNSLKNNECEYSKVINKYSLNYNNALLGTSKMLGISISEMYGAIGYSNFGYFSEYYLDFFDELKNNSKCTVFIIDAICGIAAAASGKIAHQYRGSKF